VEGTNKAGRYTAIAVFSVMLALALAFTLNQSGGPVTETTGTVQSFWFVPREGAPLQSATVRLAGGEVVQARVPSGVLVQPGYPVKVRVHQRLITGAPSYEIIATELGK
jgi:hypothetical protein